MNWGEDGAGLLALFLLWWFSVGIKDAIEDVADAIRGDVDDDSEPGSWVLILTPRNADSPPAVIGGYFERDDAVLAGEEALGDPQQRTPGDWFEAHGCPVADETYSNEQWGARYRYDGFQPKWPGYPGPWASYTVIPGAASQGPEEEE